MEDMPEEMKEWEKTASLLMLSAMTVAMAESQGGKEELEKRVRELGTEALRQRMRIKSLEDSLSGMMDYSEKFRIENEILRKLIDRNAKTSKGKQISLDTKVWIRTIDDNYHKDDCRFIVHFPPEKKEEITLREALDMGKKPCGLCMEE